MKKIIIVRHAKSSWKHNVIDHERPLNDKGLKDAQIVSKHLIDYNKLSIDFVMSSDAARTKKTAHIFAENLKIDNKNINLIHELYDFQGDNLIKTIKSCNSLFNTLLIFGHNHAVTDFVNTYGNQFIDNVPTCGVIIIEFSINDWSDLNKGNTIKTLFPRDIK